MKLMSVQFGKLELSGDKVETITRKQYEYDSNRIWMKDGRIFITQENITCIYQECKNERVDGK